MTLPVTAFDACRVAKQKITSDFMTDRLATQNNRYAAELGKAEAEVVRLKVAVNMPDWYENHCEAVIRRAAEKGEFGCSIVLCDTNDDNLATAVCYMTITDKAVMEFAPEYLTQLGFTVSFSVSEFTFKRKVGQPSGQVILTLKWLDPA